MSPTRPIQVAEPGAQLADELGIKGSLPLELELGVSPVVVLKSLQTPAPMEVRDTLQVTAGAGVRNGWWTAFQPCYVHSIEVTQATYGFLGIQLFRDSAALPVGAGATAAATIINRADRLTVNSGWDGDATGAYVGITNRRQIYAHTVGGAGMAPVLITFPDPLYFSGEGLSGLILVGTAGVSLYGTVRWTFPDSGQL